LKRLVPPFREDIPGRVARGVTDDVSRLERSDDHAQSVYWGQRGDCGRHDLERGLALGPRLDLEARRLHRRQPPPGELGEGAAEGSWLVRSDRARSARARTVSRMATGTATSWK